MSEKIIWAKNEEEAARIRQRVPGATVHVAAPKAKSTETVEQRKARQARNAQAKAVHEESKMGKLRNIGRRYPTPLYHASGIKVPGGRLTAGAALIAGGVGAGYSAGKINKAHEAKNAAIGAGGAYGAYLGGGYALNAGTRHLSGKDKRSNIIMSEHRKKMKLPEGGLAGKANAKEIEDFYRTIPHGVKFSGTRRVLARTHGVSRSGRMAIPVALAGGAGGVAYSRGQVSKGTNIGEYPYLPENIREWRENYEPIRRNPISPLQMLSSGMLMAQANAAGYGKKLTRRQAKKQGANNAQFFSARQMIYSPLGRGDMS